MACVLLAHGCAPTAPEADGDAGAILARVHSAEAGEPAVLTHDFGPLLARGQQLRHSFTLTNPTDRPLRLVDGQAMTPCCSAIGPLPGSIPPGGSAKVPVVFEPGYQTGRRQVEFVVTTDDPARPTFHLALIAALIAELEVHPHDASATTLPLGTPGHQRYTVTCRRLEPASSLRSADGLSPPPLPPGEGRGEGSLLPLPPGEGRGEGASRSENGRGEGASRSENGRGEGTGLPLPAGEGRGEGPSRSEADHAEGRDSPAGASPDESLGRPAPEALTASPPLTARFLGPPTERRTDDGVIETTRDFEVAIPPSTDEGARRGEVLLRWPDGRTWTQPIAWQVTPRLRATPPGLVLQPGETTEPTTFRVVVRSDDRPFSASPPSPAPAWPGPPTACRPARPASTP